MSSSAKSKGGRKLKPGLMLKDRYRIEQPIADGGMASVYRGTDTMTGKVVAIKCLYEVYQDNAVVQARFVDEGRIQMLLKHPNILRVFELVEEPVLAFVMEYIEGGSLEDMLQQVGVIPQAQLLEFMVPVLSALGLAHSKGIIHRDLKPSNILMEELGYGRHRPKIMDFGVAKVSRNRSLTATGTTVGTLHYMSPEQIVGSKRIDGRADIYSMGITLYKLATGEVPFNASTEFALMMAQVESLPRPPSQLRPQNISPELEHVILKSLQKKPQDRYQSIREFTEALVNIAPRAVGGSTVTTQVPEHLLNYALMADGVAEDRTQEIMRSTFGGLFSMQDDVDEQMETNELLPPTMHDLDEDDGSTVVLEVKDIEHLRRQDRSMELEADDPTTQVSFDAELHQRLGVTPSYGSYDGYDEDDGPTTEVSRHPMFAQQPPRSFGPATVDSKEATRPRQAGNFAARPFQTEPMPHISSGPQAAPVGQSLNRRSLDMATKPISQSDRDQLRQGHKGAASSRKVVLGAIGVVLLFLIAGVIALIIKG